MNAYIFLQHYWWFVVSLLGALLVFLLFVQGGNSLLFCLGKTEEQKKTERKIDDKLYEAAREFAYAGQHENALRALRAAYNQEDPRILNYMGYNTRKLGDMQLGMTYYKRALQKDENYILARSYMGQALIEQGDIEGARVQLVEIRDRGGENTWAYRALLQSLGGERITY